MSGTEGRPGLHRRRPARAWWIGLGGAGAAVVTVAAVLFATAGSTPPDAAARSTGPASLSASPGPTASAPAPTAAPATPSASPPAGATAMRARPNDGSGYWPDFSNTGYPRTPANAGGLGKVGYPGHLTDYTTGMSATRPLRVEYPDNSVVAFQRFLSLKVSIYGDNLTFVGCLFEGADPNDNLVQIYSEHTITFRYSTFKPSAYATPPGNDGTVSSAHAPPGTPFDKSWQLVTTMKEAVAVMDHNDIWGNAGLEMVTGFAGRPSRWTNNYIHDLADTARDVYHHDGIGPQSEGNGGPMVIDHNTIASLGNTNGLALQGDGVYDRIAFTNNYVSGWGYAVSIGVKDNATNITVTGNVFSAELSQLYGFLYGDIWGGRQRGSTWRDNRLQVRAGDGNKRYAPADDGRFLWPSGGGAHATDYTG
ncbi:hypothetical protein [Longispora fulva]